MAHLLGLRQDHRAAVSKAENIVAVAERTGRELTAIESADFNEAMREADALAPQIEAAERRNTLRSGANGLPMAKNPDGTFGPVGLSGGKTAEPSRKVLGSDYGVAFKEWLLSGGERVSAALHEGSGSAGGFAVPVMVEGQIVPLAPPETGIRKLATVIATTNDLLVARHIAASTAAYKAETGARTNTFVETGQTLDQFTLSAYMAGAYVRMSFELAQDVPAFQAFAVSDLMNAQQQVEEGWFISGTGVHQA